MNIIFRMTEYFTNIMLLFYLMKIFDIDVKPANVLLDSSGTVKLCDFGLTQLRQQNSKDKEDVLIQGGTLPYMSPELLQLSVYSDSIPPEARTIDAAATSELDLAKSTRNKAWSRPPLSIEFQVPMFTASGLHVRFLKVFEKSSYATTKWVRYITRGRNYQVRV